MKIAKLNGLGWVSFLKARFLHPAAPIRGNLGNTTVKVSDLMVARRFLVALAGWSLLLFFLGADGKGAEPAASSNAGGLKDLVIVFKTHFDIGYTDMGSNVVSRYRTTMIDQALQVCDRNRDLPADQQFVWTLPGWPMKTILENWPGQAADRQNRIMEAYATHGRLFERCPMNIGRLPFAGPSWKSSSSLHLCDVDFVCPRGTAW